MSSFSPLASFRHLLRRLLARRGYVVYRHPHLPKGADAFACILSHWPDWRPSVIADVGANTGQTVRRLRPLFPEARILSFEPGPEALTPLRELEKADPRLRVLPRALGATPGEAVLHLHPASDQSSLLAEATPPTLARGRVTVVVDTLDAFCARENLARIDLLKIDVEGTELAVLAGAEALLRAGAVDHLVIEAGLVSDLPRFTPLPRLVEHLGARGYALVGVHEQFGVRHAQAAEFCNALFSRRALLTPAPAP